MGDMDKVLRNPTVAALWEAAVGALSKARFSGFGNSQTGNQTVLRFKVPGRKVMRMKVQTSKVDDYGSNDCIKDALWDPLKETFFLEPALEMVSKARLRHGGSAWRSNIEVVDRLLADCPAFAEELWGAVRSLRDSGDHRVKQRAHQVALAFKEMRGPMASALRNGATRDDIVALLDEEVVRLVQDG
jgi:hypothetical protein